MVRKKAYYNQSLQRVIGNPCFLCIPGGVFNRKETEFVKEAELQIRSQVNETLSRPSIRFFNFLSFNLIVSQTRNNLPAGIQKAQEIIPGTIVTLLRYCLCIFSLCMILATILALLFYYNIIEVSLSYEGKIGIMVGLYLFFLLLSGIITSRYAKQKIANYIKLVTNTVRPI